MFLQAEILVGLESKKQHLSWKWYQSPPKSRPGRSAGQDDGTPAGGAPAEANDAVAMLNQRTGAAGDSFGVVESSSTRLDGTLAGVLLAAAAAAATMLLEEILSIDKDKLDAT